MPTYRATRAVEYILAVAVPLLFAALIGWAARAERPPQLYRLALVAPFEGLHRQTGYAALQAVRARVAEDAEKFGRRVQIVVWAVDDGGSPVLAQTRARELISDPTVLAVVGHFTPEAAAAAAPLYAAAQLLFVSPVPLTATHAPMASGTAFVVGPPPPVAAGTELWRSLVGCWMSGDGDELWESVLGMAGECGRGPAGLNASLAFLERWAAGNQGAGLSVVLPYGYCPGAIVEAFPHLQVKVAVPARADPSVGWIASEMANFALGCIRAALARGQLARLAVAEQGRKVAEENGWQEIGGAFYGRYGALSLAPCGARQR